MVIILLLFIVTAYTKYTNRYTRYTNIWYILFKTSRNLLCQYISAASAVLFLRRIPITGKTRDLKIKSFFPDFKKSQTSGQLV